MNITSSLRTWSAALLAAIVLGLGAVPPAHASDASARRTMTQAANADDGSHNGMEQSFLLYWKAYGQADSDSLRSNIQTRMNNLDSRYCQYVQGHVPPFLDRPYASNREFYEKYARFGDARGMRLYGELLLMDGEHAEGMRYIRNAAEKGDGRAAYILAEAYAYTNYGTTQDFQQAIKWLNASMAANYAPAFELMAAISWDGDWNQPWNQQSAIWYLGQAIDKYATWTMHDAETQQGLQAHIDALKYTRTNMENIAKADFSEFTSRYPRVKGLYFSYDALYLDRFRTDTSSGMRCRLTIIQRRMEHYRGTYKLGGLASVDLDYIPVEFHTSSPSGGALGTTTWSTTANTFEARLDLYPQGWDSSSPDPFVKFYYDLMKTMTADNTLVHELAHIYFSSRYPNIASFSSKDCLMTFEGHATNAAYEYISHVYFDGRLTPEAYADLFLSDEYREYFFWFRRECMSPSGLVFWDKLDRWERDASSDADYRAHTRRLDTSGSRQSARADFDSPGFHCFF